MVCYCRCLDDDWVYILVNRQRTIVYAGRLQSSQLLLTFYSNYGSISYSFWDIQCGYVMTLKSGSEVTQGHSKWYHSVDWVWFPISVL